MPVYRVVFRGEVEEGFTRDQVKHNLATLFKTSPDRIERLFSGNPAVINQNVSESDAEEYRSEMAKAGARAFVEPMPEPVASPSFQKPSATQGSSPRHPSLRFADLLSGPIAPVPASFLYRIALAFAAGFMLLLPLAYLGIIGLFGYGVYLLAVDAVVWFAAQGSPVMAAAFTLSLTLGVILILFLLKPLVVLPDPSATAIPLSRAHETALYLFVERICALVRAPVPSRIDVDHQIAVSAVFRSGLFSFLDKEFVLTIGLPLASSLNLRQIAGTLAGELGHYAQSGAMQLSYVIRTIDHWFDRVVHERDSVDDRLLDWSANSRNPALRIVLLVVRGYNGLTRGILWVFMMTGRIFSGAVARHIELHADLYHLRVAGVDAFVPTLQRMSVLGATAHQALANLEAIPNNGVYPDNYPEYIAHLAQDRAKPASTAVTGAGSSWWHTRPSDRERIDAVKGISAGGVIAAEEPATVLFTGFADSAKTVTYKFYAAAFGDHIMRKQLLPLDQFLHGPKLDGAENPADRTF